MSNAGEPPITQRRIDQIVELASQGMTDKEISRDLGISRHTVETHWQRLRERLGVKNRTAAVLASLRETVERQTEELRAANESLQRAYAISREGLAALLGETQKQLLETQKQLAEIQARDRREGHHAAYFERASQMARVIVYDLKSVLPVEHRYVSSSASFFGHDARAMEQALSTFYDIIHPEDLPALVEKSMGATYAPDERYIFLYRMRTPEPRWVFDTHQALYDADGALSGVLGTVLDIHDMVLAGLLHPVVSRLTVSAPALPPVAKNRDL